MIAMDTVMVALDIAGDFDRVWYGGLLEKLRAKGIQFDPLMLLENYLQGRTLQVLVNGQAFDSLLVEAFVPQGSVFGPVLWDIYIDYFPRCQQSQLTLSSLDLLEHRRDVAVLVVFHMAQVQKVPYMTGLRQSPRVAT